MTTEQSVRLRQWGDEAAMFLLLNPEVDTAVAIWTMETLPYRNTLDWPGWANTPVGLPPEWRAES